MNADPASAFIDSLDVMIRKGRSEPTRWAEKIRGLWSAGGRACGDTAFALVSERSNQKAVSPQTLPPHSKTSRLQPTGKIYSDEPLTFFCQASAFAARFSTISVCWAATLFCSEASAVML